MNTVDKLKNATLDLPKKEKKKDPSENNSAD